MRTIVIEQTDTRDGERTILAVADSLMNAEGMLNQYYGSYTELQRREMGDDPDHLVTLLIETEGVPELGEPARMEYIITLSVFRLNKI